MLSRTGIRGPKKSLHWRPPIVFYCVSYIIDIMENQKDNNHQGLSLKNEPKESPLSFKLEKLVTAIFMVTGLMDKEEPLRSKLRSTSLDLLSNTYQLSPITYQLMSLISISTSIGLISDMNGGIINNELAKLNDSIPSLESFNFLDEIPSRTPGVLLGHPVSKSTVVYKPNLSAKRHLDTPRPFGRGVSSSESKSHRREKILKLIKDKKEVTIKDISGSVSDCSEKTIQRELISLLKDKIIQKTGEKRWSRYFIAQKV